MYQHGGDIYTHKNCIDYSANVNPLGMPQSVLEAAMNSIKDAVNYPDPQCRALKEAICLREKVTWQCGCGMHRDMLYENQIFCGNGAADVLFALVLSQRPKRALLPVPSFSEYEMALASVDCQIDYHYLQEKDGYVLQEDILACIDESLDMVFLCNPNNPTGELIPKELLIRVADRCEETGTMLVLDECFVDFLESPKINSMIPRMQEYKHLFILKAFTKIYAVPGLRIGYGICSDPAVIEAMEQVAQPWRVSVPAQAAGVAACREIAFAEEGRVYCQNQRRIMVEQMQQMGIELFGSRANYIFFKGPADLKERMLEHNILIRSCSNYKGLGAGYFRIAVKREADNGRLLAVLREIFGADREA